MLHLQAPCLQILLREISTAPDSEAFVREGDAYATPIENTHADAAPETGIAPASEALIETVPEDVAPVSDPAGIS